MERLYEISDIDGSNKRLTTLVEVRADLDERAIYAKAIMDAMRRGDLAACGEAQAAMRKRFPK